MISIDGGYRSVKSFLIQAHCLTFALSLRTLLDNISFIFLRTYEQFSLVRKLYT